MNFYHRILMYYRRHGFMSSLSATVSNPRKVVSLLRSKPGFYHMELPVYYEDAVTFLRPLVSVPDTDIESTWSEISASKFTIEIERNLNRTVERPDTLHSNWRELLYTLVRIRKPETVVETGIFDGLSSAYILAALDANEGGRLISIDLEDVDGLPTDISDVEPGWIVPSRLQARWDPRFGDARTVLPEVVDECMIDIFLHDSLHTEEHMRFELGTVINSMPSGSVIVADNVRFNPAFRDFADEWLDSPVYWKNTLNPKNPKGEEVDDRLGAGVVRT